MDLSLTPALGCACLCAHTHTRSRSPLLVVLLQMASKPKFLTMHQFGQWLLLANYFLSGQSLCPGHFEGPQWFSVCRIIDPGGGPMREVSLSGEKGV